MSEIMCPLPFASLMESALGEYADSGSVFGIRKDRFYKNSSQQRMRRFGTELDSPIGPAAGPNSQLAENIVAAYLAGSRFIELKTVQIMDGAELRACVARPCINAADECYNVEWSTELTVQQAFDEYVKAWVAVHLLGMEFGLGTNMAFNMSVGYSLEGIQSAKIDNYLEGMRNAASSAVWQECQDWIAANIGRFQNISAADAQAIPAQVSNSVTLSTLHGCPREEIEKIAHYLLTEKGFHTFIKCNPTLLGYESARRILDEMGYGYIAFDDHHFLEDLQFDEAVAMIGRLQAVAAGLGLDFGVKITNTFPVDIKCGELPGDEMYMSGRSLFPLSITAANRLSQAFGGKIQISYSGGADAFNIKEILGCGIRPVTVATTVLKPGGYERMQQLAALAEQGMDLGSDDLKAERLDQLASGVAGIERHRKQYRLGGPRSGDAPLELFDCAQAPCSSSGCPINQQIPAYLEQLDKGDAARAFEIIANDNVLPSITGTICDHQCQSRCTRLDYDDPLQIRAAKKAASVAAQSGYIKAISAPGLRSDAKALVIGAGPAGLAAASYLRRNGVDVTVREIRQQAGGIVQAVIPDFRISDAEIGLDVEMCAAWGVGFEFGAQPGYDIQELQKSYQYIIIATGAWQPGAGSLEIDGQQVFDALDFLERSKASGLSLPLGKRVAVIGGGDVAMDCARAAARNSGVDESVIVYRRTRQLMPAQPEEIELAEADGVGFVELHAPQSFADGQLVCELMQLGEVDASGRPGITASGQEVGLQFDTVVNATGAKVDTGALAANGISLDERGFAVLSAAGECSLADVYVIGDGKAGPKTVVKAMADAKAAACDILAKLGLSSDFTSFEVEACRKELLARKGLLQPAACAAADAVGAAAAAAAKADAVGAAAAAAAKADAGRCLACDKVCEVCVDVCPNRANVSIACGSAADAAGTGDAAGAGSCAAFAQSHQVLHLDGLCNECGNCGVFCPTAGNPYLDKLTLFSSDEGFEDSKNRGFLPLGDGRYKLRLPDNSVAEYSLADRTPSTEPSTSSSTGQIPDGCAAMIQTVAERYPYLMA